MSHPPLRDGWIQSQTETGLVYFRNAMSQEVQLDAPISGAVSLPLAGTQEVQPDAAIPAVVLLPPEESTPDQDDDAPPPSPVAENPATDPPSPTPQALPTGWMSFVAPSGQLLYCEITDQTPLKTSITFTRPTSAAPEPTPSPPPSRLLPPPTSAKSRRKRPSLDDLGQVVSSPSSNFPGTPAPVSRYRSNSPAPNGLREDVLDYLASLPNKPADSDGSEVADSPPRLPPTTDQVTPPTHPLPQVSTPPQQNPLVPTPSPSTPPPASTGTIVTESNGWTYTVADSVSADWHSAPKRPSRDGLPGALTYSQVVESHPTNQPGTNTTPPRMPNATRVWTTTKPRPKDMGRSHASDGFNLLSTDVRGSRAEPLAYLKTKETTISLWGAGRVGPSTMSRRIRMHLALSSCNCPPAALVSLTRISQKSGDVRYDATFDTAEHASSALVTLVRYGPSTGKWLARRWANYFERHYSENSTQEPAHRHKDNASTTTRDRKRRVCAAVNTVVATSLNACSLQVSIAQVRRLTSMHNTSVLALQEVHHKKQNEVTPQLLKVLSFSGFRMFYGKHDPAIEGSHGVLLAVRKPLDAWEFGSPTPFHVAVILDSGLDKTLYISVYIPCHATPPLRKSRKQALAAVFGTIKVFLKSYPNGKLCVMGDWNMSTTMLDKHIRLSDLDVKSVPLAGTRDGDPAPYTFQQKRRQASGETRMIESRLDYVLARTDQDIPDLAIDYTFCGSDHYPLVCTVGSALEPDFSPPKKTFKVDRNKLSSLTAPQRSSISNYFAALETEFQLDNTESDQDQSPVVGSAADWRPAFDIDPCTTKESTKKLDHDCELLFQTARDSLIDAGVGRMAGPTNTDYLKHKVSTKVTKLLGVEKGARAKMRLAELKYLRHPSEVRRIRVLEHKEALKLASEAASTQLKDERQSRWRTFIRDGCEHYFRGGKSGTGDPKQHWNFIKRAIGGRSAGAGAGDVLLPDGDVASGDEKVLQAWSDHLARLFSDTSTKSSRESNALWDFEFGQHAEDLKADPLPGSESPLTWAELCRASHRMKRGKAPGMSGIPLEFWAAFMPSKRELKIASTVAGGDDKVQPEGAFNKAIWRIVTQIVAHAHVPSAMTDIISVWLLKKGDPRDPGNYRGIALIESLLKLVTTAFATRNNAAMEDRSQFRMEQGGFRRSEETGSQMVSLWEICSRRRACGLRTYLFFSDLKKAFDTVGHQALLRKLRAGGVRGASLQFFNALYRDPSIGARLSCGITDAMKYLRGVLQGCPASPTCFVTYINDAFVALEKGGGVAVPGMRLTGSDVEDGTLELFLGLLFADDTVTSANSVDQLRRVLLLVEGWASVWDLSFGIPKCGLMVISPSNTLTCKSPDGDDWSEDMQDLLNSGLELCDTRVPVVSSYEYLGFPFHFNLDLRVGVKARALAVQKRRFSVRKFLGSGTIPVGCRVWCLNSMVGPVATYAGELLGMCMSDKDVGLVKPIINEFNKAVEQVVRASWTVRDKKRLAFPMGSAREAVYDQYGIRDIEAVFAQMRARAFAKWPKLKTWISHLVKHPMDPDKTYDVHDPRGVHDNETAQVVVHTCIPNKPAVRNLWPNKTVTDIKKLVKWQGDDTRMSNALACYVFPPGVITKPNTCNIDVQHGTDLPDGDEKSYSGRIFHVAAARLRTKAIFKKKPAVSADLYFKSRRLHLTSKLCRRLSMRNLGFERGYHWLARARCGAFIHTRQAVKAGLIIELSGNRNCAVCRSRDAKDSLSHFLLRCNHSELKSIRESLPLPGVAGAIWRAATHNISSRQPRPTDEHLISLLLGGQLPRISTIDICAKDIPKPEREIISKAYGGSDWMNHTHPLAAAAMHITARFLQRAMPHRNASLWRDLTPKMMEYSARSLGRSHSKG